MDSVGKLPEQPPRRNSYTQMLAETRFRPDDIYIAIMGMTGSGKSSLIATCCPEAESEVGHALESKTTAVRLWTFEQGGLQVHLIDTPGFDDTNRSDSDVLKDLAYWLGISYEKKKIRLTGLIYLHPISHVRMAGTPFKNLRTFRKMVGSQSMSSVALVSTMWGPSSGKEENDRDDLLRKTPQYWGKMIDEGAKAHRHFGDRASAMNIIGPLLKKEPTVLNLQQQLVIEKKDLNNTDAGREVDAEMTLQREALERKIEATKEEMDQALAAKDEKWVQDLAADQEKYQKQIQDTKSAQEEMKLSMAKIFAEKEEQYKQSIKEMDERLQDFETKRAAREKQYEADKEKARLDKEEAARKAVEQEEEIDKARTETEEANNDKYAAQLAMIWTVLKETGERDQEYQSAVLLAQKHKDEELMAMQKEAERIRLERELVARRQQEHDQAMMMQQQQQHFQYQQAQAQAQAQVQAQMWQHQQQQQQQQAFYESQAAQNVTLAAAAGGTLGLMGAASGAATMCCIM